MIGEIKRAQAKLELVRIGLVRVDRAKHDGPVSRIHGGTGARSNRLRRSENHERVEQRAEEQQQGGSDPASRAPPLEQVGLGAGRAVMRNDQGHARSVADAVAGVAH